MFLADLLVLGPVMGLTFSTAIARASASRASDNDDNTSKTDVAPWCYRWVMGWMDWIGLDISGWGKV